MSARSAKIRWSRRVEPYKIRRLYEGDAQGMLDEELLDDVGYGIYVCCQESIALAAAAQGNVECRNCFQATIVRRLVDGGFDQAEILKCPVCGWDIWCGDYHKSLLRKAPARP